MKTKTVLLSVLCIALALTSMTALYAAGVVEPAAAPAVEAVQATQQGVVVGADALGLFDPLAGAVQTSCPATCFQAFQDCKAQCGGQIVCVDTFNCDNGDPCNYVCVCTGSCPPSP